MKINVILVLASLTIFASFAEAQNSVKANQVAPRNRRLIQSAQNQNLETPPVVRGLPTEGEDFNDTQPALRPLRGNYDYDNIMAWCSTWITDLEDVRWQANQEAMIGGMDHAADMLYSELIRKASEIGVIPNPAPHTADAIKVGVNILAEVFRNSANVEPRIREQVRFLLADSVYGLIKNAFEDLDQRFYSDVMNTCRSYNCRGGLGNGYVQYLPQEYYDGVRQLGVKVLHFQERLDRYEATNTIEMRVSHAVVNGAKNILLSSVLSRSLACPINKLIFTERQILRFLNGGSNMDPPRQIMTVRGLISDAKDALIEAGCENNIRRW